MKTQAISFALLLPLAACTNSARTPTGPGLSPETSQAAVVEDRVAPGNGEGASDQAQGPAVAAPSPDEAPGSTASETEIMALASSVNAFGASLYERLAAADDGNVLVSPVSVAVALHMTLAGADGVTRAEMEQALQVAGAGDAVHAASGALQSALSSEGESTAVIANRVWIEQEWAERIRDTYRDVLQRNYGGGFELTGFVTSAEAARQRINAWVAEQTRDKIPELIPFGAVTELTRVVLTNAVYFDAGWVAPFDKERTTDGTFHAPDGAVEVPLMRSFGRLRYLETHHAQIAALPYTGGEWEMVVVLPRVGAFEHVEADLAQTLAGLDALRSEQVDLTFPKFTFRWSGSLVASLRAVGMGTAFTPQADFSRLANLEGTNGLYVSDVIHEAFIEVDEEGTEAAAATAVIMVTRAAVPTRPPVELKVDRPFLFAIRHVETGTWLFVGRVTNPTK